MTFRICKRIICSNIFDHWNSSLLKNKYYLLVNEIRGNVDDLVTSETKLDDIFPEGQSRIPGFAPPSRFG